MVAAPTMGARSVLACYHARTTSGHAATNQMQRPYENEGTDLPTQLVTNNMVVVWEGTIECNGSSKAMIVEREPR